MSNEFSIRTTPIASSSGRRSVPGMPSFVPWVTLLLVGFCAALLLLNEYRMQRAAYEMERQLRRIERFQQETLKQAEAEGLQLERDAKKTMKELKKLMND